MSGFDTVIEGVLLGGVYALFALGLSLIFGIMRLVNLAHGDLILLAAYLVLSVTTTLGVPLRRVDAVGRRGDVCGGLCAAAAGARTRSR